MIGSAVTRPLVAAAMGHPTERTPLWVMRQAGRYLPEYRELRTKHTFQESVSTPKLAAEVTAQPIRRFDFDGAVIFADIMTPLEAMGVEMTFDPGPKLRSHTLAEVIKLGDLATERVSFVGETIERVRGMIPETTAIIGFAGAPLTLLAYLIEGGGSREFLGLRAALAEDPGLAAEALASLGRAMNAYLDMQVRAGADVIQLFDTWAGMIDRETYSHLAAPAAKTALAGHSVPRIYFAPGASHTLEAQRAIGPDVIGVDWRLPLGEAWSRIGDRAIQGNLDPAVLLTDEGTIGAAVRAVKEQAAGRPGHIFNLGHGIDRHTPLEHVAALVSAVRS
ncbi:MAG: uroporphyrinogen decarboxylase [Acidimicrobiia bacterium]